MKSNFYIVSDSTIQKESNYVPKKNDIVNVIIFKNSKICYRIKEVNHNNKTVIISTSVNHKQEIDWKYLNFITYDEYRYTGVLNKPEFCFQNGNLVLPFKIALVAKYSFKDIADILNISCQEVCNQFNQMAKESGYSLFH